MRRLLVLFGDGPQGQLKLLGAAVVAVLAMAALGLTLVYRTTVSQQFRQQTVSVCLSIEAVKADIRDTLQASRDRVANRTDLDVVVKQAALSGLNHEIKRYAPDKCPSP